MTKYLNKKLVLPLVIATVISLILAYFFSLQGFFINLATTFIGILLTVLYVDLVLREHEKRKWGKVQYRVDERVMRFANRTITRFRTMFKFKVDIINRSLPDDTTPSILSLEIARVAEQILIPATLEKMNQMSVADWKRFGEDLSSIIQEAEQLIALYGNKLAPDTFSLIFEIQEKAQNIFASYYVFPEAFGMSDEEFITAQPNVSITHKQYCNRTANKDAEELLAIAASLLRSLPLNSR